MEYNIDFKSTNSVFYTPNNGIFLGIYEMIAHFWFNFRKNVLENSLLKYVITIWEIF